MLEDWACQCGICRGEGQSTIAKQVAGQAPQTQFGRAMKELGVALLLAHSPQAKGRVERLNGVLQVRLDKALRLEGIRGGDRSHSQTSLGMETGGGPSVAEVTRGRISRAHRSANPSGLVLGDCDRPAARDLK